MSYHTASCEVMREESAADVKVTVGVVGDSGMLRSPETG